MIEDDLREAFKRFGDIVSCNVVRDKITRLSKEFGFIKFEDKDSADKAVSEMNETVMSNKKIKVEISKRGGPRTQTPGKYLGPRDDREGRDQRDRFNKKRLSKKTIYAK